MSTTDDNWRVGGIELTEGHIGPESTVRPGESYDLRCILTGPGDIPDGESGYGLNYGVDYGGRPPLPEYIERYQSLLEYGRRAGEFDLHEVDNGRVAYTETHDGAVPDGTLVVSVAPPVTSSTGRGGWYLVESVEDATDLPQALCDLRFSLVYLAPLAQSPTDRGYQTRSELAFDLESDTLSRT